MKAKRKFKQGDQVVSAAELLEHDWFFVHFGSNVKTVHKAVLWEWKLRLCQKFIDHGWIFIAERLTNGEYHKGKSDDELLDMLETDVCEYCEGKKNVIGSCEGRWCDEALETWKEALVK